MSYNVDMAGCDLIVNTISTGASTPGAAGTNLNATPAYIRVTAKGLNFNSASTDNAISFALPTGTTTYKVEFVTVWGASHTLTTATAGLFTAASAGGVAIVANGALTPTSGTTDTALDMQSLTIASATTAFTDTTLYFRIGTAEGAAATANVTLTLRILG
jgi:hypothetical protein